MPSLKHVHSHRQFLGFDFSTQQLKAVLTDFNLEVTHVAAVQFETDLPEYGTHDGVIFHEDGLTFTSPVQMWLKALDMLLSKMVQAGVDFSQVAALSGAGQQHGSVYWKHGARALLNALSAESTLHDQLKDAFSRSECPIWMDASTNEQCKQLENAVGGPMRLAQITGSKGFERFTGNQIKKIHDQEPHVYKNTERISLVSSFGASLFLGDYASIDWSDGSGMNLLNISTHEWEKQCLDACGENLLSLIGDPVPSQSELGVVCSYFVEKYGFSKDCAVIAFTGDNPASMAGINQKPGDVAVSLGTSDTVFVWLNSPIASLDMHVLCNPIDKEKYMGMLVFKNGALTRERVKNECGCQTWEEFNSLLTHTEPGNSGHIGFYFDFPEILPGLPSGDHRFKANDEKVAQFEAPIEARAVIEHQCLAKRVHAEALGYEKGGRILVTGGASTNPVILQILSDVFESPVFVQDVPNSAALGSAYRAKHGLIGNVSFAEVCKHVAHFNLAAEPSLEAGKVYHAMAERYKILQESLLQEFLISH